MKNFCLLIQVVIYLAACPGLKADNSVLRGVISPDTTHPEPGFYETISATVASNLPLSSGSGYFVTMTPEVTDNEVVTTGSAYLSGTNFLPHITGSATLVGNVLSHPGGTTTNNTAIHIYPKNLPTGAYQVWVVLASDGSWQRVGSFVMPAYITSITDTSDDQVVFSTQTFALPVPVAPLPDCAFSGSNGNNSLGTQWITYGVVRFATADAPALVYKKKTARAAQIEVSGGDFDPEINPFDIQAVVVTNALNNQPILTHLYKDYVSEEGVIPSCDTTNNNLLSLVLPGECEPWAGGLANLKTSYSRNKRKPNTVTQTASLTFAVTGLPPRTAYEIDLNGALVYSGTGNIPVPIFTGTTNGRGMLTVTSHTLASPRTGSGLVVLPGKNSNAGYVVDFPRLTQITLWKQDNPTPAAWVGF